MVSPARRVSLDAVNLPVWGLPDTRADMNRHTGVTDPGERVALDAVLATLNRRPILDLGFGTGRTVSLLAPFTDEYVGIDYTPEMVVEARTRHPGVDLRHGDARDLSQFPDAHFGLVVFSFNGIDAVDPEGRRAVLREIRRVLALGGRVLYSTHNLAGPGARERPWKCSRSELLHPRHLLGRAKSFSGEVRNRRRLQPACMEGPGWAIRVAGAHGFRIAIHYTAYDQILRELVEFGLGSPTLYSSTDGSVVTEHVSTRHVWWFHVVATAS